MALAETNRSNEDRTNTGPRYLKRTDGFHSCIHCKHIIFELKCSPETGCRTYSAVVVSPKHARRAVNDGCPLFTITPGVLAARQSLLKLHRFRRLSERLPLWRAIWSQFHRQCALQITIMPPFIEVQSSWTGASMLFEHCFVRE